MPDEKGQYVRVHVLQSNCNCKQAASLSHSKSKEKVKIGCMMVWGWLKPESQPMKLSQLEGVFFVFKTCKLRPGLPSRAANFPLGSSSQQPIFSWPRNARNWWGLWIASVSRPCPATNASSNRSPAASCPADVSFFHVWSVGFILLWVVSEWRKSTNNTSHNGVKP